MALPHALHGLAPFPSPQTKAPQSQITIETSDMTKQVVGVWSVRRFRAWRRGLTHPIWQVTIRICPLQRPHLMNFTKKVQRVGEPQVTTSHN